MINDNLDNTKNSKFSKRPKDLTEVDCVHQQGLHETVHDKCMCEIRLCVTCHRGNANRMAMWYYCACIRMPYVKTGTPEDCGKGLEDE